MPFQKFFKRLKNFFPYLKIYFQALKKFFQALEIYCQGLDFHFHVLHFFRQSICVRLCPCRVELPAVASRRQEGQRRRSRGGVTTDAACEGWCRALGRGRGAGFVVCVADHSSPCVEAAVCRREACIGRFAKKVGKCLRGKDFILSLHPQNGKVLLWCVSSAG